MKKFYLLLILLVATLTFATACNIGTTPTSVLNSGESSGAQAESSLDSGLDNSSSDNIDDSSEDSSNQGNQGTEDAY